MNKSIVELRGLNMNDILKGFIIEMNNYGFTEYYIGRYLANIVAVLNSEEET